MARASDSQCRRRNCPGFDPSILQHSGILGAADERVLNTVHKKPQNDPFQALVHRPDLFSIESLYVRPLLI